MKTSKQFKIIVIGCAAVLLVVAIKTISESRLELGSRTITNKPSAVFRAFNQSDSRARPIQSVDSQGNTLITWRPAGEEEKGLIHAMTNAVRGITPDGARKLIIARFKYNWKDVPDGVKGPDLEGMYAFQLKSEISQVTTDISAVLNAPIGDIRYPPHTDTIIRTNMVDEIDAIAKQFPAP